jgi:hypothetical protein
LRFAAGSEALVDGCMAKIDQRYPIEMLNGRPGIDKIDMIWIRDPGAVHLPTESWLLAFLDIIIAFSLCLLPKNKIFQAGAPQQEPYDGWQVLEAFLPSLPRSENSHVT